MLKEISVGVTNRFINGAQFYRTNCKKKKKIARYLKGGLQLLKCKPAQNQLIINVSFVGKWLGDVTFGITQHCLF